MDSQNNNVLAGDLKYLGLGDLIQLLGTNGSSGSLRLSNPYVPEPAFIYFEQGDPINALYGEKNGLEALLALFGWAEGEFEFIQEKVIAQKVIQKSRMGIILEGLRLRDDGQIEIVGPNSQFTPKSSTDSSLETNLPIVKGPLIDYMYVVDEEDFFDGEHVVEQGRHGNWIWVILEGVVEILKETPEIYVQLEEKTYKLQKGIEDAIRETGIAANVNRFGSMMTIFSASYPYSSFSFSNCT